MGCGQTWRGIWCLQTLSRVARPIGCACHPGVRRSRSRLDFLMLHAASALSPAPWPCLQQEHARKAFTLPSEELQS